jgi:Protein of unknown function (DUF4065)
MMEFLAAPDSESDRKLAELLLYVAEKVSEDRAAGAVRINKILFFAEFAHVRTHGAPITGAEYQKLRNGPAPRRLKPIRDRLVEGGEAELVSERYFGRRVDKLKPLRPAREELFSPDELAAVDEVIEALSGRTAEDVSNLSHREMAWRMVDEGDTIPFSAALLARDFVPTESRRRHARGLASSRRKQARLQGS